jgi:hypothetical protein
MAVGLAPATANAILTAMDNGATFSITALWVKLHIGDPGAAGTANPAVETTRKQASFGTPAGGVMATDAAMSWVSVAGTEDYTHYSLWSASTAGTFHGSGLVTANAVTAGDNFDLPSGQVTLAYNVAA